MCKYFLLIFISSAFFLNSCSKFNPFDDKVQTSSDGAYVIETGMTDEELLSYGKKIVYRFKSVPNMVAVKEINIGKQSHSYIYLTNIYNLPFENTKIRMNSLNNYKIQTDLSNCNSSYCEANFDKSYNEINSKNLTLNSVNVAIVDSGVIPATNQIKNNLVSSFNLTGNLDTTSWSSHATYIASIFTGITKGNSLLNVYGKNAKINSVKITFADDNVNDDMKNYGSMQLAAALDVAVFSGAKIVNLSLSYLQEPDQNVEMAEKIVISNASKSGVIFIVAAGNESNNFNKFPTYPAAYNLNNMIIVASHTYDLSIASSSNYGDSVELSAQGSQIDLNSKNGSIDSVGGTSFSGPLVASAISIYLGLFPNADLNTILNHLFSSANAYYNPIYTSRNNTTTKYGRLDTKAFIDLGFSNN